MQTFPFFILISILSYISSLLKKYDSEQTYDGIIFFDAQDFKEGEEMHFKIKAYEDSFVLGDFIGYFYNDGHFESINYDNQRTNQVRVKTTLYDNDYGYYYATKYFTIKKQKSEFGTAKEGKYLVIYLPLYSGQWAMVTNTKEDEGKLATWAIIVIVVVAVIIIVVVIICYCVRRAKRQKALAAANANAAAAYAANQDYQAQVYQAQVNQAQAQAYQEQIIQAQINQAQAQAYQDQLNQAQAQAYQNQMNQPQNYPQNYPNDGGYNNDPGYSSNAVAM